MFEALIIFMIAFTGSLLSMLATLRTKVYLASVGSKTQLASESMTEAEQVLAAARHAVRKTLAYADTYWVMSLEQYSVVRQLKDGDGSFVLEYVEGEERFLGKDVEVVRAKVTGRDMFIVSRGDEGYAE